MRESFGARLRRKREEQQIPLAAIAADTKIKVSLLEALERDDLSGWPSGIFRRGYVRAYARAIGLDADAVVSEFAALYPEPDESDLQLSAAFPKSAEPESWRDRIWQFGRRSSEPDAIPANPPPPAIAKTADPANESTPAAIELPAAAHLQPQPPPVFEPDLAAAANLCTELGRVADAEHLNRVLDGVARLVNAFGLIIWVWDRPSNALVPAFAHGYAPRVLASLQPIARDSDNPTAAAFQSAQLSTVKRTDRQNGAVVAPLMRAGGCIGVLAIEVQDAIEQVPSACDLIRIVAAQIATLFDVALDADTRSIDTAADDERATGGA